MSKSTAAAERVADALCIDDETPDYCCKGMGWSRLDIESAVDRESGLPELLAALHCFVDDERFEVSVGGNPNVVPAMIAAAKAALAKAEASR